MTAVILTWRALSVGRGRGCLPGNGPGKCGLCGGQCRGRKNKGVGGQAEYLAGGRQPGPQAQAVGKTVKRPPPRRPPHCSLHPAEGGQKQEHLAPSRPVAGVHPFFPQRVFTGPRGCWADSRAPGSRCPPAPAPGNGLPGERSWDVAEGVSVLDLASPLRPHL